MILTVLQTGRDDSELTGRAEQDINYSQWRKGYISVAFRPARGEALAHPYRSRRAANWVGEGPFRNGAHHAGIGQLCKAIPELSKVDYS